MPVISSSAPHATRRPLTRRAFLFTGGAGLALATYAGTHARHELEITRISIPIRNLPDAFAGFRFVQISDIHLREYTEPWFFERVIDQVNALNPELVLFTGDLVSSGPGPRSISRRAAGEGAEILTHLKAPQRFAIIGNHDALVGTAWITHALRAHGTPVLSDSYVSIERGGDRLWLCGTRDILWDNPDLNRAIPADARSPVILMAHEPDYADFVLQHPLGQQVDLMLSGHTHGGQVRLPVVGPLVLPKLGAKYVQSLYSLNRMQLYVNRGVGAVGVPFRLNCPPEITEITLIRA